jgi:4-hydroxythreonine-4-phosphate dehydrogenase
MKTTRLHLFMTSGDPDGIGLEVTLKALKKLNPTPQVTYVVLAHSTCEVPKHVGSFRTHFVGIPNPDFSQTGLNIFKLNSSPADWVQMATQWCLDKTFGEGALATAPMSKGPDGQGHTEILSRLSKSDLRMGFLGSSFNVLLATTHIPVSQIEVSLTTNTIQRSLRAARKLHVLGGQKGSLRILGLNPHSGESGLISKFDATILKSLQHNSTDSEITTLESPDAAFTKISRGDTLLAWYHDQGLIPFKMRHGFAKGIQVTLGLPFIRTSVDHGTAKCIFGRNQADASSMLLAIQKAQRLSLSAKNTLF